MELDNSFNFPTLGLLVSDWIVRHTVVPTGFKAGSPFVPYAGQFMFLLKHYAIKPTALWMPSNPILAPSFVHRRSQIVRPQKYGKGPIFAAITANEAVGPSVFCGWAKEGDEYSCAENFCDCGWTYKYSVGEPMGMRHPSPLIQITAYSQDQTDNVYVPLKIMIKNGLLADQMKVGEEFIRILRAPASDESKIEVVTSSALSRLGNPITFAVQDETGTWTKANGMRDVADAQRRGLAGMSGRSIESTNSWDKAMNSVAQQTFESKATDVYRDFPQAPAELNFEDADERREIFRIVYGDVIREHGGHVDLDAIDAECVETMERDPAQAKRFFGNILTQGLGAWMPADLWQLGYAGNKM